LSLRGLTFSSGAEVTLEQPLPIGLRGLSLGSPTLTDAGLLQLLAPFQFPELHSLWVSNSRIGDDALAALTAYPCLRLGSLYLIDNLIGSAGAWRLLTSPHLPALRALTLEGNRIGADALASTTGPATDAHLSDLDLSRNPMTPEVGRVLLCRPELALLEKLTLSHSYLGPEGGEILAQSQINGTLKNLLLCGTGLGDEGVMALSRARFVGELRDLSLQDVELSDEGLSALVRTGELVSLLSLRLDRNPLGPEAGSSLAQAPWLGQLSALHLSDTALGDDGAAVLAASPRVHRLVFLGLNEVGLTVAGARAILDSPHLSNELHLHIAGNAPEIQEQLGDALSQRFAEVDYARHPHVDMAW
jgi:hypothetical protein